MTLFVDRILFRILLWCSVCIITAHSLPLLVSRDNPTGLARGADTFEGIVGARLEDLGTQFSGPLEIQVITAYPRNTGSDSDTFNHIQLTLYDPSGGKWYQTGNQIYSSRAWSIPRQVTLIPGLSRSWKWEDKKSTLMQQMTWLKADGINGPFMKVILEKPQPIQTGADQILWYWQRPYSQTFVIQGDDNHEVDSNPMMKVAAPAVSGPFETTEGVIETFRRPR